MENLKDIAYHTIKEKIINCTFAPGSFLDSAYLVQVLNMSRTPIREAITRLEQEGLVQVVSQKGVLIQNITLKNIRDTYAAREVIEPQMILRYGREISPETLLSCQKRLQADMSNMSMEEIVELDDLLHKEIMYASNNDYFISFFQSLCDQNRRIQYMTKSLTERREKNQEAHLEILELLMEEKYEKASELMEKHLKNSMEEAFCYMMEH